MNKPDPQVPNKTTNFDSDNSDTIANSDTSTKTEPVKVGVEVIKDFVKRLPMGPGVYRMLDAQENVLYVGKARSLKKRVSSYTRLQGQPNRTMRMIMATSSMEFIETETEPEALLLEANLIKQLRPRFNVLLRDDKSFPYILVSSDHPSPALIKHRGARTRKGDYFGPFANASAVNDTITAMQKAFLLRNCTDSYFANRSRPCLQYQIKRCAAPCTNEISKDGYNQLVKEAKAFLSGRSHQIKKDMATAMEEAAEQRDYETAAVFRDRISALSHVQSHQGINPQNTEEADVFALHNEGGQSCIQVFFFRTWQNWGNRSYFPKADKSYEAEEILQSFITQFYGDKPVPKLVLISHQLPEQSLLEQALSASTNRKIEVIQPKRGEKKELLDHALSNAKGALGRKLAETSSQTRLLKGVGEAFNLDRPPRRIDVYDNSHIQGAHAVGAMIVTGSEGFAKKQYRKFNINASETTPGDDYAMMREVLTRRFKRLLKEAPDEINSTARFRDAAANTTNNHQERDQEQLSQSETTDIPQWPDLVLIDGGQGQLQAVRTALEEIGITHIPLVGIAKGPDRDAGKEKFFIHGKPSFMFKERDPVLYFVQRLRDEAHRFAIGTHRSKRKKENLANPLDEVTGIGPARKRALLRHFGSAKAVSRAGLGDLEAVEGISAKIARIIYNHFHE
ncbi:excinuclease ABC subunit UvrC [Polycladidibacter stylochi]|uniref:excinuclease ABC subunit UvrC n=1 Tax=Polycladidibacter stylochi TaxID=1807766 RepID=UPI00082D62F2|nr:excinuclease ABC subunit UvrC [Pseudovibrio stylochi]